MAIPLVLMMAGTAMQMIGQYSGNMAQAAQEKQNAKFYAEQAHYAQISALRAETLAEFSYTNKLGQQLGAYASGGVDSSGSASITMGGTIANMLDEVFSIRRKGEMDVKLARMRGIVSQDRADTMGSVGYNVMQAGTTAISNYASSEGFGKGFPSLLTPSGSPKDQTKEYKYGGGK